MFELLLWLFPDPPLWRKNITETEDESTDYPARWCVQQTNCLGKVGCLETW